eukprot:gnl/Spiro4/27223_TR13534_c0_g1_i1.p2 gnl/Spiro4/27223_TR13534_c0_g1~~gnl/Spiro4/27223_TR13534_c0_g1_i1.p2  ORF type:complete len:167 (-),score=38.35 gnl/Spiro4/27223_TR13534_c0_g1_i1:58-558(-)
MSNVSHFNPWQTTTQAAFRPPHVYSGDVKTVDHGTLRDVSPGRRSPHRATLPSTSRRDRNCAQYILGLKELIFAPAFATEADALTYLRKIGLVVPPAHGITVIFFPQYPGTTEAHWAVANPDGTWSYMSVRNETVRSGVHLSPNKDSLVAQLGLRFIEAVRPFETQ